MIYAITTVKTVKNLVVWNNYDLWFYFQLLHRSWHSRWPYIISLCYCQQLLQCLMQHEAWLDQQCKDPCYYQLQCIHMISIWTNNAQTQVIQMNASVWKQLDWQCTCMQTSTLATMSHAVCIWKVTIDQQCTDPSYCQLQLAQSENVWTNIPQT